MKFGCTPLIVLGVLVGLGAQWRPQTRSVEPPEIGKAPPLRPQRSASAPSPAPAPTKESADEALVESIENAVSAGLALARGVTLSLGAGVEWAGLETLTQRAQEGLQTFQTALEDGETDRPLSKERPPSVTAPPETRPQDGPLLPPKSTLPPATRPGIDAVFNNPFTESVDQVERYLRQHVHDASSLKVIGWGPVEPVAEGYRVRCRYQSRNVLGKATEQIQLFTLDRQGRVIDVVSQDPPDASSHRLNSP